MKTSDFKKSIKSVSEKCNSFLNFCNTLFFFILILHASPVSAQPVLFDFNNVSIHSPLPIDITMGGITAHFSGTGDGFSIQEANVLGFVPLGFSGNIIYPNSIYLADLHVSFDQTLTDFSIMYTPQELGCDDSATMRVTAYMNGSLVGTNTKTATNPGTWPVDTLGCNFPLGFNSVVVHYDSHPPTCQDYGVIFMADNMLVTPFNLATKSNLKTLNEVVIVPNPISQSTTISFSLFQSENINITVYDITGRLITNLLDSPLNMGEHQINWDINNDSVKDGVYILKLTGENFSYSYKLIVVK